MIRARYIYKENKCEKEVIDKTKNSRFDYEKNHTRRDLQAPVPFPKVKGS